MRKDINPYSMTSIMHTENKETEKKLKQAQPRFSHVEMGGSHGWAPPKQHQGCLQMCHHHQLFGPRKFIEETTQWVKVAAEEM